MNTTSPISNRVTHWTPVLEGINKPSLIPRLPSQVCLLALEKIQGKKAWEDLHVRWCHSGSIGSSVSSRLNLVSPVHVLTINTNKLSPVLGSGPWQLFLIERVSGCWVYKPGTIQSVPPIQLQYVIGTVVAWI